MLPEAAKLLQPYLIFLGLFGMLYGGLLAWRQSDLKAMVAYSSISHMGIVLLGIATLNEAGITGAVLQMTAHGLIAGALFLLVGLLYERTHTRNIQDYSSLLQAMPRFAVFMILTLLAAIGLPGSVGFIAELHTLIGGFTAMPSVGMGLGLMVFFSVSILIGAAYAIRTISLLFTGSKSPSAPIFQRGEKNAHLQRHGQAFNSPLWKSGAKGDFQQLEDLTAPELLAAGTLVSGIVLFGLLPAPLLDLSAATISQMNTVISQRILQD
jgi:NADH-quinone oxidoreductase subunit M